MRRVAVVASASGNGKTTVGRAPAERLGVPFHELDALHWGHLFACGLTGAGAIPPYCRTTTSSACARRPRSSDF